MTRPPDPGAAIEAVVLALWPYLRPLVLEAIGGAPKAALVDVAVAVPGPKRSLYQACRSGRIRGAVHRSPLVRTPREHRLMAP